MENKVKCPISQTSVLARLLSEQASFLATGAVEVKLNYKGKQFAQLSDFLGFKI